MKIDVNQLRHELIRWYLLKALDLARPYGLNEMVLLSTIQGLYADATQTEVRRELDYLDQSSRALIRLEKRPNGIWHAEIDRYGVDLVEYNADCDPGIARPVKQ